MDRFEGRCWLDWWANSSTLLGSADSYVVITNDADGWHAHGRLCDISDLEPFTFLCKLDPVFMLRFAGEPRFDDNTLSVSVDQLDQNGNFVLLECSGTAQREINYKVELASPDLIDDPGGARTEPKET